MNVEKSSFYVDERKRILEPEIFNSKAEEVAKKIRGVTKTQIRRVFDELKRLKRKVEKTNSEEEFRRILPYILMERSRIAYTVTRAKKNAKKEDIESYNELKRLFDHNLTINNIKSQKDYINFCDFMEAIVAFHYEISK